MSNFDIFNQSRLKKLIEPYVSGMAEHITPIKYEAITPDIFAFLFRTTGKNGSDHYFISLEFDFIESLEAAKKLIEDWHGAAVIGFWNPETSDKDDDPRIESSDIYHALLAEVERPKGEGYWATNSVITSPKEIDSFVSKLDVANKDSVRESLEEIFNSHPSVSVSVFIHGDEVEYFYN